MLQPGPVSNTRPRLSAQRPSITSSTSGEGDATAAGDEDALHHHEHPKPDGNRKGRRRQESWGSRVSSPRRGRGLPPPLGATSGRRVHRG